MYCPRIVIPPIPFLFLAIAHATTYTCVDFMVPMSFTAETYPLQFPEFQNHYQSVAFLTTLSSRDKQSSPVGAPVNISVDVNIATQYCSPIAAKNAKSTNTVQLLSHGLGFDHSYWAFGGPDSSYNYIAAATAAGYATLSYDRLGTGNSTVTNPYTTQQLGIEVAVAATLTSLLKEEGRLSALAGHHIPTPQKVVHVGHSFGSLITANLAGLHPALSDGVVLTGFSTVTEWILNFAVGTNFYLAREADPERFGDRSTGYLTWRGELANQLSFFHYPAFEAEVLARAEATKFPFAIGELVAPYDAPFPGWRKPLLVRNRVPPFHLPVCFVIGAKLTRFLRVR